MYTSRPSASLTWRSIVSIGAAAYLTGRAPSTANSRSGGWSCAGPVSDIDSMLTGGIPRSSGDRLSAELREEIRHRRLDPGPSGDPLPVRLDRAGERVAAVDRRDQVHRRVREAVRDQAFDVRLESLEHRV